MKLSFWTMGMPDWTNAEIAQRAKELGYDGVDLRCTEAMDGKPTNSGNLTLETSNGELADIKESFAEAGIAIASMLGYNWGGRPGASKAEWDVVEAQAVAYARVAEKLGTATIRVMYTRPNPRT